MKKGTYQKGAVKSARQKQRERKQWQLNKMKVLIESHKKISIKDLAMEMFGEYSPKTRLKTHSLIYALRASLKEQGILLYSIGYTANAKHQILTEDTILEYAEQNKKRIRDTMISLQKSAIIAVRNFPELKKQILLTMKTVDESPLLNAPNNGNQGTPDKRN